MFFALAKYLRIISVFSENKLIHINFKNFKFLQNIGISYLYSFKILMKSI